MILSRVSLYFSKGRKVSTHTEKHESKNKPSEEIKHYSEVKLNMPKPQIVRQVKFDLLKVLI